jgi:uncharacterized protein
MKSTKKQPQRTCVACRKVKSQREMVRLVSIVADIEVDVSAKKPGRGAYLCYSKDCWEKGLKKGSVEYALKTSLNPEKREKLLQCWQDLERDLNQSGKTS